MARSLAHAAAHRSLNGVRPVGGHPSGEGGHALAADDLGVGFGGVRLDKGLADGTNELGGDVRVVHSVNQGVAEYVGGQGHDRGDHADHQRL